MAPLNAGGGGCAVLQGVKGVTYFDQGTECMERADLARLQLDKARAMLRGILPANGFYQAKLRDVGLESALDLACLDDFRRLPFTRKAEIAADQRAQPPFGTNLTYPIERYVRVHQTSGTTGGVPIRCPDTAQDWVWWHRLWGHVYRGAGVGPGDRVFFAFSFGPFIGFWSAFDSASVVGAMAISGGGQQSLQRLTTLLELGATVLMCTPTYALRLAEVAREEGLDIRNSAIRATIHAGEPGASIPSTRQRIEDAWGAECHDHIGMTEIGATGYTCVAHAGVHLIESEYIFETIDPETGEPVSEGMEGELVVTNLGRWGMPLIRYRTGDRVKLTTDRCECGRTNARLEGGILGRADDMVIVRGVNLFPSSVEDVVRQYAEVDEFRIEIATVREMKEVRLVVEIDGDRHGQDGVERVLAALGDELHRKLSLRVPCRAVTAGTLPRFELKAKRLVRLD